MYKAGQKDLHGLLPEDPDGSSSPAGEVWVVPGGGVALLWPSVSGDVINVIPITLLGGHYYSEALYIILPHASKHVRPFGMGGKKTPAKTGFRSINTPQKKK